MGIIENIPILRITSIAKEEREAKEQFDLGYNNGYETGKKEGMNLRLQGSSEVPEYEYYELLRFLDQRNLIISYSQSYHDKFSRGLIVRKSR
jgi:flagellar biosynthesis/type III secretory pathway protein FliH